MPISGAVGSSNGVISHPGYVAGTYYLGFDDVSTVTSSSGAFTINFIYYYPFIINYPTTLTRLCIYCNAAVTGANLRLGVASNEAGIPKDLLVDGGNIAAATIGPKESTISLSVEAGLYWLVGTTTLAPTLATATGYFGSNYNLGQTAPTPSSANCGKRNALSTTPTVIPSPLPVDNLQLIAGTFRPLFWFKT